MRCCSRRAGRPIGACSSRAGPTRSAPCIPRSRVHVLGLPARPLAAQRRPAHRSPAAQPGAGAALAQAGVDRDVRGQEGASDHAPAWIALAADGFSLSPSTRPSPPARAHARADRSILAPSRLKGRASGRLGAFAVDLPGGAGRCGRERKTSACATCGRRGRNRSRQHLHQGPRGLRGGAHGLRNRARVEVVVRSGPPAHRSFSIRHHLPRIYPRIKAKLGQAPAVLMRASAARHEPRACPPCGPRRCGGPDPLLGSFWRHWGPWPADPIPLPTLFEDHLGQDQSHHLRPVGYHRPRRFRRAQAQGPGPALQEGRAPSPAVGGAEPPGADRRGRGHPGL